MPRNLYYLSDQAYDNLWRDAVATKYVHRGATSGKGIAEYVAELSKCHFDDNRPQEYRDMDAVRRAEGLTLYWSDGDTRRARMLTLDEDTIERLCILAAMFHIGLGKSHRNKKIRLRSTTTTIAKVLEAIGKRWLITTTGVETKQSEKELHAD